MSGKTTPEDMLLELTVGEAEFWTYASRSPRMQWEARGVSQVLDVTLVRDGVCPPLRQQVEVVSVREDQAASVFCPRRHEAS